MSKTAPTAEHLRLLCEQAGLTKALKLFPDGVMAAAERGLRPLGNPPPGNSPIAAPASVFDPAHYEKEQ